MSGSGDLQPNSGLRYHTDADSPLPETINPIIDAVETHLAESVSQGNPHGIDTKANKSWEDYIELNCLNEWTPSPNNLPRISKNDLGEVHLIGRFNTGILTRGTAICNIPIGYRPEIATPVVTYTFGDKTVIGFFISSSTGNLTIIEPASNELSTSTVFIDINIIYKAKE